MDFLQSHSPWYCLSNQELREMAELDTERIYPEKNPNSLGTFQKIHGINISGKKS